MALDVLHRCCAGLDVHKDTISACVRRLLPDDTSTQEIRSFGTMTQDLLDLLAWLRGHGVTIVAMESTGVYWKPVFNVLATDLRVLLVNAEHVKQVEGRKTDAKDCAWIAQLLQHGLLRPSFVPPEPVRALRDLTRQRSQLVGERVQAANRIQKVLEDANVKLGSVASDVLGKSGRDMLEALIGGESDPAKLAELARGRLRAKLPALRQALRGRVTEHHRFLLRLHLDHLDHLDELIDRLTARLEELLAPPPEPDPPAEPVPGEGAAPPPPAAEGAASGAPAGGGNPLGEAVSLLTSVPGISRRTAQVVVAEIGADMEVSPTAGHLASWAGLCPGNCQSAGKRLRGRTRRGNRWLKQALVEAAWAASRCKKGALPRLYRRLRGRKGAKRALIALAHRLLLLCWHLLKHRTTYQEPPTPDPNQAPQRPAEAAA
jgi:transposase